MPYPLEEKHLKETEQKLGVKFPESYRKKMMEDNGGELTVDNQKYHIYPINNPATDAEKERTRCDIITATDEAKKNWIFPNNSIVLAANGAGDILLYFREYYTDKLRGRIFYWNCEIGYVKSVAEDITDLL